MWGRIIEWVTEYEMKKENNVPKYFNPKAAKRKKKQMPYSIREQCVHEFQKAMEQDIEVPYSIRLLNLRMSLIREEMKEFESAVNIAEYDLLKKSSLTVQTKAEILKELCDLLYVLSGFAVTFGLSVQPAFNRVHESNMSKLVDGKPQKDDWGKVQKGDNYKPPKLEDLV